MAKLSMFVYAEDIKDTSSVGMPGRMMITGPLLSIVMPFIPNTYSFSIAFGLTEFKVTQNHTVQIKFINDESKTVILDTGKMDINFNVLPLATQPLDEIMMNSDFKNVIFENEGIYHTEIIVDGKLMDYKPSIKVRKAVK